MVHSLRALTHGLEPAVQRVLLPIAPEPAPVLPGSLIASTAKLEAEAALAALVRHCHETDSFVVTFSHCLGLGRGGRRGELQHEKYFGK